jgi:hypothetical protein
MAMFILGLMVMLLMFDEMKRVVPVREKADVEPGLEVGLSATVRILLPDSVEVMKARLLSSWIYSAETASISVRHSPDAVDRWEAGHFRDGRGVLSVEPPPAALELNVVSLMKSGFCA